MLTGWREMLDPRGASYDSGVPQDTPGDALITAAQPILVLALTVFAAITVEPIGLTGRGLLGTVLIVVSSAVLFSRSAPDRVIGDRGRLAIAAVGAVASGALYGFDPSSFGIAYCYFLAFHIGLRFAPAVVAGLIGGCVLTAAIVMVAWHDPTPQNWMNLAIILLPLGLGIGRRVRRRTLRQAHELVAATRRAGESEARATALAERARMARDIHDVLAHSLSGVNMQLSLAEALFEADRVDDARAAVERARAMVVDGLGETRKAVQALREDTVLLLPALSGLVTEPHEHLDLPASEPALEPQATIVVLRTAQEALTNARRHAPGARVWLRLSTDAQNVRLVVENESSGAEPSDAGSGLGLLGMRERAASVAGTLTAGPIVEGELAGGWRVALTVPAATGSGQAAEVTT